MITKEEKSLLKKHLPLFHSGERMKELQSNGYSVQSAFYDSLFKKYVKGGKEFMVNKIMELRHDFYTVNDEEISNVRIQELGKMSISMLIDELQLWCSLNENNDPNQEGWIEFSIKEYIKYLESK